jgi:hypothetical protein
METRTSTSSDALRWCGILRPSTADVTAAKHFEFLRNRSVASLHSYGNTSAKDSDNSPQSRTHPSSPMTERIFRPNFLASFSVQAEVSFWHADKNSDSRLSPTEAKALPSDLRDNFANLQSAKDRTGKTVAIDTLVKEFQSYAEAASARADRDHDSVLSASEIARAPDDLRDNLRAMASFESVANAFFDGFWVDEGNYDTLYDEKELSLDALPAKSDLAKALAVFGEWSDDARAYEIELEGKKVFALRWFADESGGVELFDSEGRRVASTGYPGEGPAPEDRWVLGRFSEYFEQAVTDLG